VANPDDFAQRLRALGRALGRLERYVRDVSRDRLLAEEEAQDVVFHALFVAAQASADLVLQVCAVRKVATGRTYADAFRALGEAGLLDAGPASEMPRWASFRNVVAHFYPVIDFDRVHAALQDTGAMRRFEAWAAWVE
jgi:uncharacterized protein YutE (UPF0331/DUF86 family)